MAKRGLKHKRRASPQKVRKEKIPVIPYAIPSPEDDSEEDCDGDGLTMRRRAFVEAITGIAMGNATKAARIAGYASDNTASLQNTASRLLGIVGVSRAIARKLAERRMDPNTVRADIATLANSSMANFGKVVDGKFVVDWNAAAAAGAIGEIREVEMVEGADGTQIVRKFKIYDRTRAAELLAKMNGQLTEKHEVRVSGQLDHEHRVQNAVAKLLSDPVAFSAAKEFASRITKPNGSGSNGSPH